MKNIWIVNYYTPPPQYIANPRHIKFAEHLKNSGYNLKIISSSHLHKKNTNIINDKRKFIEVDYNGYEYIHIKTKSYDGNGFKRMFSIFEFAYKLFRYCKYFEKPDLILHNIHMPFDYPVYWCAKKMHAKYIAEAWDLWPEQFVDFGLISRKSLIVKFAFKAERSIYKRADKIIFSMEGGRNYIINKKWDLDNSGPVDLEKICYINNGVDINEFDRNKETYVREDKDLRNEDNFNVVYIGAIRKVNNLMHLVKAANILKNKQNIKFLIYGDGNERQELIEYCNVNKINNVIFKETWIPLRDVPYVLSRSSLNILNYEKNFGKYGISSGKLFQYLAAGKPICANIKMNYCLIEKYNLGIAKDLVTPQEYADAIYYLSTLNKQTYKEMCDRARSVAYEFDYDKLTGILIKIIQELTDEKNKL